MSEKIESGQVENQSLLTLDEVLNATGGDFIGSENNKNFFCFTSVAIDSRNVVSSSLFIPLIGENQDGHKFCPDAVKNGATVIFIAQNEYKKNPAVYNEFVKNEKISVIAVENTLYALQNAASAYVQKFPNLIKIAITGSSGKTTSKEMIVSVLRQKYNVVYTQGNFNSETGLPLSVFNIRKEHEVGVFEMGMNRQNEINEISSVLKANYALVTNIGTAHIGILKTQKNIAKEKKHIFDYITQTGAAFIPALDGYADFLAKGVKGEVVYFGPSVSSAKSGVRYIQDCGVSGTDFSIDGVECHLNLSAICNYTNALGAVAIGKKFGLSAEQIKIGLESLSRINGRMETESLVIKTGKKITLIKDCYNANPDSMKNVLAFCKSIATKNQVIYVLGDMLELGKKSIEAHKSIGSIVAHDNPALCVFVGEQMKAAYEKSLVRGFKNAVYIEKIDDGAMKEIAAIVLKKLLDNDILLIKASRGIALERIIDEIAEITEKQGLE